jgi:hypothetical protein
LHFQLLKHLFQHRTVVMKQLLQSIAQVFQQMPPIGYLDCFRGALADTVNKGTTTITGNNFDGWMGLEPGGDGGWLTVG